LIRSGGVVRMNSRAARHVSELAVTPTAVLVRQVLGAVAQFEKAIAVAKLAAARKRKRLTKGKCEDRRRNLQQFGRPAGWRSLAWLSGAPHRRRSRLIAQKTSLPPISAKVPAISGRSTRSGTREAKWLAIIMPGIDPTSSEKRSAQSTEPSHQ
jgi:hypothetical protein